MVVVGVPIASLVRQTGLRAAGQPWSSLVARQSFVASYHTHRAIIVRSLLWATVAGATVSGIALLCCWLARERRWLRVGLLVLLTFAWTMPGPVIGIGL